MAKQIFILFVLTIFISTATYAAFPLKNQQQTVAAGVSRTEIKAGKARMLKQNIVAPPARDMFSGQWKTWNILLLILAGIIVIAVLIILLNPE